MALYKSPEEVIKTEIIAAKATVTKTQVATITQWECWFQVIDGKDAELNTASTDIQKKYPEYKVRFDKTAKLGPCIVMEYDPTTKPALSAASLSTKR